MTVQELIAALKKHEPTKKVVVRGYEDGYNGILRIVELNIIPHPGQTEWFYGEYDCAFKEEEIENSTPAIELYGENTKGELR